MKGIVILFCIAGLLLAVTPANAQSGQMTGQAQGMQQSNANGKTAAPAEVKKEVAPQTSTSSGNTASPAPQSSPEKLVNTARVPATYSSSGSNQGGQSHPGGGGGGESGGGYGSGGGYYHGRGGYYQNPWRNNGFSADWDVWAGPGPVFVPDYDQDYTMPYATASVRLDRGVYVQSNVSDAVGSGVAYAVNDHAQADNLVPVSSPDQASLELFVASADEDPIHPGTLSAVSVTYIWLPGYRFITSQVMNVGASQVDAAAGSVADEAAQLIQTYRH